MTSTQLSDILNAHAVCQHPSWYQALTLTERLKSLHAFAHDKAVQTGGSSELADRRLQKWKAQKPFGEASFFADRLALDDATEEDLHTLLSESIEAVQARTTRPPEWLLTLEQAFTTSDAVQSFKRSTDGHQQNLAAFLEPITPLLKYGGERLLAGIQVLARQHLFLPFEKETIGNLLFSPVLNQLLSVLMKTLTLELNIARLQERLQGETPEERFRSFIQYLCEPGTMLALLEDYPVLARLLVTTIDQGVAYGLELLGHLCSDWSELRNQLAPEHDPGTLSEIQFGAGDVHRQGRSVVFLTFRSGFKLVYKPKSLAIDTHFQDLLTWLNERGEHLAFRTVGILDKGVYGWSEYVQGHGCSSEEELACFYERLGGYMALMYVLEGTDLHFENVIACGEHPMLIDLETLFQPHLPVQRENKKLLPPQGITVLQNSVMRLGLLPQRMWANAKGDSIDISGLGGEGGQLTPSPVTKLEALGTDQMRLVRERLPIPDRQNRPTLNGATINILDYLDQVSAGFTRIYRLLISYREDFLTQILSLFACDEIRIVLRPTKIYGHLLQESLHPTLLRNALDRDRFLDRLWVLVPGNPLLAKVVQAEIDDLRENNIPIFTTRLDSCILLTSQRHCIPDFCDESGLATVESRIQQLNEQDLSRQLWIIQASFATKVMGSEQSAWKSPPLLPARGDASQERLLQAACAVGDRLCELAICGDNEVSWLSLQLGPERAWLLTITSLDLYSGTGGICLFLAYLGVITNENRYTALARQVADAIRVHLEKVSNDILSPGAFSGWGGLLYLYTHLAVLWGDATFLTEAEELIERFADTIETDTCFDVIAGVAGGIRGLLTLHRVAPSSRTLKAALRCGDHLLAHATAMPQGQGWLTPQASEQPLTGYSHGTAGIALSLLELAALSGEERFHHAALAALEYERSRFSLEKQNWPDLRGPEAGGSAETGYMVTWCHGAPGIGLARLGSLEYVDDPAIRKEIAFALNTTLAHGFDLNHSLCHGALGNLDVLHTASQILDDGQYSAEVAHLAAMLLESIEQQGWCTGVPLGIEIPGLLTGIAGIGYELLRLAYPDRVPSVLLLAPPQREYA